MCYDFRFVTSWVVCVVSTLRSLYFIYAFSYFLLYNNLISRLVKFELKLSVFLQLSPCTPFEDYIRWAPALASSMDPLLLSDPCWEGSFLSSAVRTFTPFRVGIFPCSPAACCLPHNYRSEATHIEPTDPLQKYKAALTQGPLSSRKNVHIC